jgi:hypothetical protein
MMPPMLEQSGRFGRDLPLALWKFSPGIHLSAHLIDDGGQVILLLCRR